MNIQFYLEKLNSTEEFKDFQKENPDSYLCSGFFVIDKERKGNPDDKVNLDFYSPNEGRAFSFEMGEGIKVTPLENFGKTPERISKKCDFSLGEIEEIIFENMEKNKVKAKVQRIILSLQNLEGRDFVIGTIFISMLGIVRIDIDLKDKKATKFEKKSLMEMFKVLKKGDV